MKTLEKTSVAFMAGSVALVALAMVWMSPRVPTGSVPYVVHESKTLDEAEQNVSVVEIAEDPREPEVTAALASIHTENKSSAVPAWAGEYYCGDGLDMNLVLALAPQAGMAYQSHGCLGLYEQNLGSVVESDSEIKVKWKYHDEGALHRVDHYIHVRWGNDHFLVPKPELLDFCVRVRLNDRTNCLTLRKQSGSGREDPLGGELILPLAYEKYRDMDHLTATVVAAESPQEVFKFGGEMIEQTVTLDLGQASGIVEHMRLYHLQPKILFASIEIESVSQTTSRARYRCHKHQDPPFAGLTVGQTFSTDSMLGLWEWAEAVGDEKK